MLMNYTQNYIQNLGKIWMYLYRWHCYKHLEERTIKLKKRLAKEKYDYTFSSESILIQ